MPAAKKNPGPPTMRLSQAAALTMGFAQAAGAHSIGLIMYNAAEAQQAVQQVEIAALGFVLAKMAAAAASSG
jgi:hypothetical protein